MNASDEYEKCRECGEILETDGPCPHCQSSERVRVKPAKCAITVAGSLKAEGALVIGWQEVDRLLGEREYAAALLVAAVNVEFILEECLEGLPAPPEDLGSLRSIWGEVGSRAGYGMSLGSLVRLAEWYVQEQKLSLSPVLATVEPLKELRRKITHERGYFAKLTQLKDPDWPETRICRVLAGAKAFCHENG